MALFNKNPNEAAYVGGKKHWTDVIKNSGSGELLIWRQPEEDFNTNSTLVVMPGEEAIFIKGGTVEPAPCKAQKGNCPYGGDEQHFDTIEKAQEYADKENAEKYGILSHSGDRSAENVEGFNAGLEERLFSKHVSDRIFAARRGYGAEILAKDENKNVRLTLAEKGFVPDTLAQDKDPEVRERVLLTNGDKLSEASIEALSNDEKWYIRQAIELFLRN